MVDRTCRPMIRFRWWNLFLALAGVMVTRIFFVETANIPQAICTYTYTRTAKASKENWLDSFGVGPMRSLCVRSPPIQSRQREFSELCVKNGEAKKQVNILTLSYWRCGTMNTWLRNFLVAQNVSFVLIHRTLLYRWGRVSGPTCLYAYAHIAQTLNKSCRSEGANSSCTTFFTIFIRAQWKRLQFFNHFIEQIMTNDL